MSITEIVASQRKQRPTTPRNLVGPCVRIKWDIGFEFVPVHPDHPIPTKFETVEHWSESKRWVVYHPNVTKSKIKGGFCYNIVYSREEHPELHNDPDVVWGTSTIKVERASRKVTATWKGSNDRDHDGTAPATILEQSNRSRSKAQPTIRNQSELRNLLLATDRVCAITGESTPSALECAHIVSVNNGGFENRDNAILLRADLHCLLDSACFAISPQGQIIINISKNLSKYYADLLKKRRIDNNILGRIQASLFKQEGRIFGQ